MWSLLVCLGLHINFSSSELILTQCFCFLGLVWGMENMSVSLPTDKLPKILHLAPSLLYMQPITVYSPLGHFFFVQCQHLLLTDMHNFHLCCVVQSDMFMSLSCAFICFFSLLSFSLCQLQRLSPLQQSPVPLQFPHPDVVITGCYVQSLSILFSGYWVFFTIQWNLVRLGSMCDAHMLYKNYKQLF